MIHWNVKATLITLCALLLLYTFCIYIVIFCSYKLDLFKTRSEQTRSPTQKEKELRGRIVSQAIAQELQKKKKKKKQQQHVQKCHQAEPETSTGPKDQDIYQNM
nr:PREDICTED: uncharacterized protein LOC102346547 [Latimeria chalumnae]|eukprot:XP_014345356.1 PREDICTED: uncharacterized protein LOC102346547 [Latimeria chalumnae]